MKTKVKTTKNYKEKPEWLEETLGNEGIGNRNNINP